MRLRAPDSTHQVCMQLQTLGGQQTKTNILSRRRNRNDGPLAAYRVRVADARGERERERQI